MQRREGPVSHATHHLGFQGNHDGVLMLTVLPSVKVEAEWYLLHEDRDSK